MPTTYAHWRFGADCIETLPESLKTSVLKHRDLFDIGVHGPDIFFYHLRQPQIPEYGHHMHQESARAFFEPAVRTYQNFEEDKEAMMAFLLGYLSHFALDVQCHGYINRKDAVCRDLSHNKIESQYDAYLIMKDGKKVPDTDRTDSVIVDHKSAAIIARFFPFDEKDIYTAIRNQKYLIHFLEKKSNFGRYMVMRMFGLIGRNDYRDLVVTTEDLNSCRDSNLRLDKLTAYALEVYPHLVKELMDAIDNNKAFSAYFDRNFDPNDDSIPILSYEEEQEYIPVKISDF